MEPYRPGQGPPAPPVPPVGPLPPPAYVGYPPLNGPLGHAPSFTGRAVAALVLYVVLYVPGLLANLLFLHEAHRVKQEMRGRAPAGYGCLVSMLLVQVGGFIVLSLFTLMAIGQ